MNNKTKRCRCNCGYKCGGPGVCKTERCYTINDGQHYVVDCEHKWGHDLVEVLVGFGELYSVECLVCGESKINHDMRNGV